MRRPSSTQSESVDAEARLDAIEAGTAFQAMADRSDEDFRKRRFISHAQVQRQILSRRKTAKK